MKLVDMMVLIMFRVVVMVVLQMIHMELVQTAPLPQNVGEDTDMTNVLNSMGN